MLTAILPRSPNSGRSESPKRRVGELAAWLAAHQNILILIAFALWVEIRASLTGGDSTWDMRNYHLYNPFALFNGKFAVDIAPAGL